LPFLVLEEQGCQACPTCLYRLLNELSSYSIKRNHNAVVVTGLIQDGKIHNLLIVDKNADKAFRILGTQAAEIEKSNDPSIVMSLKMLIIIWLNVI